MSIAEPILECRGVSKTFGGIHALDNVDYKVYPGRVNGLVGANGAGKSTLMKILSGVYRADLGSIYSQGVLVNITCPKDSINRNIVTVYQEVDLISTISISDNIFLNNEKLKKGTPFIALKEQHEHVKHLLEEFCIDFNPDTLVKDLPSDLQKMIQIIKAFSKNARVLLMDEPTSSLTSVEVESMLNMILQLKAKGVGIVFISHYLSEVFRICDEITTMRDGRIVRTSAVSDTTIENTITDMIGMSIEEYEIDKHDHRSDEEVFSIKNLSVGSKVKDITLTLGKGEILGITGLIGSGVEELAKGLFRGSELTTECTNNCIEGKETNIRNTSDAIAAKFALIPSNRKDDGLFLSFSVEDNIALPSIKKYCNKGNVIKTELISDTAEKYIRMIDIKAPSVKTKVKNLSGGNQQKVLFSKWLETSPRVFIMDEPTIGIDVGAKYEIRKIIQQLSKDGCGIILVTSELDELEALCDRVVILFRGKKVCELTGNEISKQNILRASTVGQN